MTTSQFPVLDDDRRGSTAELGRVVLADLGAVEPHIDELDCYCVLPIRLAHNAASGLHLELGPYDLDPNDIERIRRAIASYDEVRSR